MIIFIVLNSSATGKIDRLCVSALTRLSCHRPTLSLIADAGDSAKRCVVSCWSRSGGTVDPYETLIHAETQPSQVAVNALKASAIHQRCNLY